MGSIAEFLEGGQTLGDGFEAAVFVGEFLDVDQEVEAVRGAFARADFLGGCSGSRGASWVAFARSGVGSGWC